MGSFRFRLQVVRDLRHHAEMQQQDTLRRERRKLDILRSEGDRLAGEYDRWSRRYTGSASRGMTVEELRRIHVFLDGLARQIMENARRTADQETAVERERLALVERVKERRIIDTLHDRRLADFLADERHTEEKRVEEMMAVS